MDFLDFKRSVLFFISISIPLLLIYCSRSPEKELVIAKVGRRVILQEDFINRAELAPRPNYCSGNTANDKRIILNSLIAEKILAAEAEQDTMITRYPRLRQYIRGIKEQKMRELYFKETALDRVSIPEEPLKTIINSAGRRYTLSYFDVGGDKNLDSISFVFGKDSTAFARLFKNFYPDQNMPVQNVNWRDVLQSELFDALYVYQAEPGKILGPVIRQDGRIFYFRVDGWQSRVNLSETEQQLIRQNMEQYVRSLAAHEIYEQVIADLMAEKKLEFRLDGLVLLTDALAPIYMPERKQYDFPAGDDPMQKWKEEVKLDSLRNLEQEFSKQPVFTIDGVTWTIEELLSEIEYHPLVFRKRKFPRHEFGEHLKQAIVDLVRDYYLTKECYAGGYDRRDDVLHAEKLWQDYFYSVMQRQVLLNNRPDGTNPDLEFVEKQIRDLKKEYTEQIWINLHLLDGTEISGIRMLGMQQNVPYPVVTPPFPLLTREGM